jgi:hypothetical protein
MARWGMRVYDGNGSVVTRGPGQARWPWQYTTCEGWLYTLVLWRDFRE